MNILTHAVHTGYQYDLAKTGHEFYSLDIPGSREVFWDRNSRPQPRNFHRLSFSDDPPVKFDLILVHFGFGYDCLKRLDLPLIFKEHCLKKPFRVPRDWLERITYYSFASQTAAKNWAVPSAFEHRKVIIGMGMDLKTYFGHHGRKAQILVVGQNISSRGNEKGYENLMRLTEKFRITVVGMGNEGILGATGAAKNYAVLQNHYRNHRVFLNPSNILGMSTLEAMATGAPVVTFRTVNSDVIRDGFNGLVVDTAAEAERALHLLLRDKKLSQKLGRNARNTIKQRFSSAIFVKRWNELFRQAVHDFHSNPPKPQSQPFDISQKPADERAIAESVTAQSFEYHRVGYDKREMRFLRNGRVGKGAGGRELFWDIKLEKSKCFLEISSGNSVTCLLKRMANGTWKGRWLHCEKMPIILKPI